MIEHWLSLTFPQIFFPQSGGDSHRSPCEGLLNGHNASEAIFQHELSPGFDLLWAPQLSLAVCHCEGERSLGDIINFVAAVGCMARCGFTALLGADAGDDEPPDTSLHEPDIKYRANERTMAALLENGIGLDGNSCK